MRSTRVAPRAPTSSNAIRKRRHTLKSQVVGLPKPGVSPELGPGPHGGEDAGSGVGHLEEEEEKSWRSGEGVTFESLLSQERVYLADLLREAKGELQSGDKKNGVTYALFGASNSGKSTLLRKIFIDDLYKNTQGMRDEDEWIMTLFTGSKYADPLVGAKDTNEDLMVDNLGLNADLYQWMYNMNYTYDKRYNFVVLIDDIITVKNYAVVFQAFLTYRNMNITSVVSLQYLKLCPLPVRSSLYFCFLLPINSNEGIEQLVRGYLAMYLPGEGLQDKINQYKILCKDHCFFLMDNLRHKCFYVDNEYYAREVSEIPKDSAEGGGGGMRRGLGELPYQKPEELPSCEDRIPDLEDSPKRK
jgi:hypothetical protein